MDSWAVPPPVPTKPNPPSQPTVTVIPDRPSFEHITKFGHTTLWVAFAIMLLSTFGFVFLSWRVTIQKRLFHQVTTFITVIATLSYFAMATGSGWSFTRQWETHEHKHDIPDTHHRVFRQVFWARYVDWLFTTPLLLLDLSLLAGVSGSNIINIIFADVIMVLSGQFAAFAHTSKRAKWGWYTIGWIAFGVIIYQLAVTARATAQRRGVQRLFGSLSIYTLVLWTLYPIVWGISEGSRKLTVNQEVLAYAILDVLAKPVFGAWLLIAHQRLPASNVHVGGAWSEGFGHQEGTLRVGDDEEA